MLSSRSHGNPVLPGFYPDPTVCRVGDEFFVATSSFVYWPGVPVFRSTDLVEWTQVGNVLDRSSQADLSTTTGSAGFGIYAPTLRYHHGRFWLITTNVTHNGMTNFFVTADDPGGPWSDAVTIDIDGFDPDLAWDEDGNCWVHFSNLRSIQRCRIDDRTGEVLEPAVQAWEGTGLWAPEGPHLLRRGDIWYLLIAEGGTERGHGVAVARSLSPTGPWESCPANPILSHRSTMNPIQNAGHADLVEAADGSWWMVLLGVRPRGGGHGFHVLGRETFLTPVTWDAGWPVPAALDVAEVPGKPWRDDFDTGSFDPAWVALRRLPEEVASLEQRPGSLVVADGGFVARRQQHHRCVVRTLVEGGDARSAGLRVFMDEGWHYDVTVRGGRVVAEGRAGGFTKTADADVPPGETVLVVEMRAGESGPDVIALGFEDDRGDRHVLLELDGRFLATEVVGGFTGRTIGMFSEGGPARFDWFEYVPIAE